MSNAYTLGTCISIPINMILQQIENVCNTERYDVQIHHMLVTHRRSHIPTQRHVSTDNFRHDLNIAR